jgi:hypothetical protein
MNSKSLSRARVFVTAAAAVAMAMGTSGSALAQLSPEEVGDCDPGPSCARYHYYNDGSPELADLADEMIDAFLAHPEQVNKYWTTEPEPSFAMGDPVTQTGYINITQCVHFVKNLLMRLDPSWFTHQYFRDHFGASSKATSAGRTDAWYGAIRAWGPFDGLPLVRTTFGRLQRGDMIISDYVPDDTANGHAMIVRSIRRDPSYPSAVLRKWIVSVADSSSSRHSMSTLAVGRTGAQRGEIAVFTRASDPTDVVSWSWTVNGKPVATDWPYAGVGDAQIRPLTFARMPGYQVH